MHFPKYIISLGIGISLTRLIAQAADQNPEFRAFWADAWHEGFQSAGEVSNLISNVRAANCNAVFVQVRKRGDAYYQGSPFEPAAKAVKPDFDPLGEIIREAHDTNSGP